jgi:pimeloyl-ACP methyl ester carboxylesterase
MLERFFQSDDVRLRYLDGGAGETIVLLHGFTHDADRWVKSGAFERLASRRRVLALDCRGHGQSDKPHDPERYRDMELDVALMLDDAGVTHAHCVGYSMGAALVGRLLIRRPARVLTATFVGATGMASTARSAHRARLADAFERGDARALVLAVRPPNEPPPDDEQLEFASARVLAGNDPLALAAVLRAPITQVTAEDLLAVSETTPMLGVAGTEDSALNALFTLQKTVPRLEVVAIDGASHPETVNRPDVTDAVERFLDRHVVDVVQTFRSAPRQA